MFSAIIGEDNIYSRQQLSSFLTENNIRIVGEASNGLEVMHLVQIKNPQVVFIDIDMPIQDGVSTAKQLKEQYPSLGIVFITGYTNYAIEAFDIDAIDYIVKPFEPARMYKCLCKIKKVLGQENPKDITLLKINTGYQVIQDDQILYFTSEKKMTKVTFANCKEKTILINETLKSLENRICQKKFVRTHRSFIVNISHINKIEPSGQTNLIFFKNHPDFVYLSKNYMHELLSKLS
ncbi:response regulator transcription factor [Lysinibacillus fusiformis]|nr:response regulator transcription factor [Lysinibacillus fusiformis]